MSNYTLKFLSKNKNFLNNSFIFFVNNKFLFKDLIQSYYQKKTKIKKFSLLKSPHVNKTAQEQFEFRVFCKNLNFYSIKKNKLFLVLFKKYKNNLFSNLKLNIKIFITNHKVKNKININTFNINLNKNFKSQNNLLNKKKNLNNFNKKNYKKVKNYLKLIDLYGEIIINKKFW